MEDIFTVQDYNNGKIHGSGVIVKADKLLRLRSVKNQTVKAALWRDSMKVIPRKQSQESVMI